MYTLYEQKPLECERYYPLSCYETSYSDAREYGSINENGSGLENKFTFFNDIKGSKEDFLQQATDGDIISQCQLGCICCRDHNHEEGQKWLRTAADNNDAIAQYFLGCSYYSIKNLDLAIQWFKTAADNNNTDAEYLLGRIYYFLDEYQEAIKWYKKLAKKNISWAERELGAIYFLGEPSNRPFCGSIGRSGYCSQDNYIKPKIEEAIKWLKKASDHGNRNALLNLGLIHFHRYNDYTQAKKNWQKAADQGDLTSAYYLGKYSIHDKEIDREKYLLQASASGQTMVKRELGIYYDPLYSGGCGTMPYGDLSDEAKIWYEQAAGEDDLEAIILCGNLSYSEKDYDEALKWYNKAIDILECESYGLEPYKFPLNKKYIVYFINNNYIDPISKKTFKVYKPDLVENFLIDAGKILYQRGEVSDALAKWHYAIKFRGSLQAQQLIADYYYKEANCEKLALSYMKNREYALSCYTYYKISCELHNYKIELERKIDAKISPAAIKFNYENYVMKGHSLNEYFTLTKDKVKEYRAKLKKESGYQEKLEEFVTDHYEREIEELRRSNDIPS